MSTFLPLYRYRDIFARIFFIAEAKRAVIVILKRAPFTHFWQENHNSVILPNLLMFIQLERVLLFESYQQRARRLHWSWNLCSESCNPRHLLLHSWILSTARSLCWGNISQRSSGKEQQWQNGKEVKILSAISCQFQIIIINNILSLQKTVQSFVEHARNGDLHMVAPDNSFSIFCFYFSRTFSW